VPENYTRNKPIWDISGELILNPKCALRVWEDAMSERKNGTPKPNASEHSAFRSPRVIAALVTAIATIVAAAVGSCLTIRAIQETNPETYDLAVNLTKYPIEKTSIEIREGDEIEVVVLGANSTVLNCGVGVTTVMGMVNHELQPAAVLPTSNLCSLIGRIGPESAPHFAIGAYTKFVANISGSLSLGTNDVIPERCWYEDCFADNTGTVFVRVTVHRK
jgi:hypothetical protein